MIQYGTDFDRQPWAADYLIKKPLDYPSQTLDFLVAISINQLAQAY